MDASYVMGLDLGPPGEPTGFAVLEWPATDDPTPEIRVPLAPLGAVPAGHVVSGDHRGGRRPNGQAAAEGVAPGRGRDGGRAGRSSIGCTRSIPASCPS